MSLPSYLTDLNAPQKEAVLTIDGPLLIVAGAGAGKTKTLTHRIVHLIHQGIAPEHILAITFTNKAASEMRERTLAMLAKERIEGVPFISTFHALGVHILKENARLIGRTRYFTILDEGDAVALVKEAIVESNLDPKQYEPRRFKGIISREKGNFVTAAEYRARADGYLSELVAEVWDKYQSKLKAAGAFDFDDLLLESVLLLKNNESVRKYYQDRFRYVHIDEYQDTNVVQYELGKLLVGPAENICVVGDTDQNIYSWRGANIRNILHFEKDYPRAKIVLLEENYRSTKIILEAANEIIKKNNFRIDKKLFTQKDGGEKIGIYESYDEAAEAGFVAARASAMLERGVKEEDIAVLYRANFQSRVLEEGLLLAGIPYQVLGTKFYERKEVKDILAYIRAALNPDNLADIKRIINIPARGIGKVTLVKLFSGHKDKLPAPMQKKITDFYTLLNSIRVEIDRLVPSEIVKYVMNHSGIEAMLKDGTEQDLERLENIKEMVTLAQKYDFMPIPEGIEKLLEDAALASDQDSLRKDTHGIKLMTVHASKGLEFSHVFVVGLEQDLFPHQKRDGASGEDSEEERRLFYVALTRAKEKLFLSHAMTRTIYGSKQVNMPSEFLFDIPEALVEQESMNDGGSSDTPNRIIYFD